MAKFGEDRDRQMTWVILPTFLLAIFLLSGCNKLKQFTRQSEIIQKQQEEIKALNEKVYDLEAQLNEIQQDIKSKQVHVEQELAHLDSALHSLATDYAVIDSNVNKYKTCIFDKNSKGFQRVDTDLGQFFISLSGISEHQNGRTLHLSIFNPSVYEIPGFALRLRWGRAFNSGESTSHDDWLKSLQSKDEHFTEHLRPGRWNKIDVSLGPVQAEQLEYIIIEMEVDNIMATSDTGSHGASKHSPNFLEWTSP